MPGIRSVDVVHNEKAGRGARRGDLAAFVAALGSRGVRVAVRSGKDGNGLLAATKQALAGNADAVVAAGGDGTIRAVVEQMLDTDRPFGVVPLGTFNFFARNQRLPASPEAMADAVAGGAYRLVDVAEVGGRTFLGSASLGLYTRVLETRGKLYTRFVRPRLMAYASVVAGLVDPPRNVRGSVVVGEKETPLDAPLVFATNNALQLEHFGLGEPGCLEGGNLALFHAPPLGRGALAARAALLLAGSSRATADLERHCAPEIVLETDVPALAAALDGESFVFRPPLRYRVHRGALRLLVPTGAEGAAGGADARREAMP